MISLLGIVQPRSYLLPLGLAGSALDSLPIGPSMTASRPNAVNQRDPPPNRRCGRPKRSFPGGPGHHSFSHYLKNQ